MRTFPSQCSLLAMLRSVVLFAVVASVLSAEPNREAEKHLVVIVGAGVSGFTAAATLLDNNVTDVLLLEASDRIGGRIHTVEFGGVTIDKGAEFVHGEVDNAVFELVSPYNLLTSYQLIQGPETTFYANTSGAVFNSTQLTELMDKAYAILYEEDIKNFHGSVADYFIPRLNQTLLENHVDPQLGEAIHHLAPLRECVYSGSDDLHQLGASSSMDYKENEGDLALKWKTGGYKIIFDFLSKKFPNPSEELPVVNKTMLGKQVTRVERKDKEVLVECADGSSYLADHVIITLSLGVLKKHAANMFDPPLSEDKSAIIKDLGFGCVGKIFLLFPQRWWPNDTNAFVPLFSSQGLHDYQANSVHGSWTSYTTGFYPVINHHRMLCAWFSGDACRTVETLPEEQVIDGLLELLKKLVGDRFDIPRPESILRTGWASYPYTLGAYSFRTVANEHQNLSTNPLAQAILDENDKPLILFAGEATHPYYWSTVHGALGTGRREAQNIINYLNKHPQPSTD